MYLVVDGNFIPLLGCDACLDLEVLEFMNLELITTPESKQPEQEMPNFFQTNPALQDYKDCFSDKPGKLPYKVHLEVDPSVKRWKKMGLLLKKRNTPLGFHLC